jgi:SAM-dependent methyltransferase
VADFITEARVCRICGGPFDPLLNLGSPVLSDFLAPDAPDPPSAPLDLVVCQRCETVQLRHTVDQDRLFRNYWYRSGINEAMKAELSDVAALVRTCTPSGTVLDIGANDGTLLSNFQRHLRIGVEPARNISPAEYTDITLHGYFPQVTADLRAGSVDAATSIATFYASPDPLAYVREIDRLLAPDGVWIVQMQDLGQMVGATAFDNAVAEHVFYYSARTFARLLIATAADLHITYIEQRAINGGSLRFVIRRRSQVVQPEAVQAYAEESWLSRDALDHFAWRVGEYKAQLLGAIDRLLDQDGYLDLYAASTKSSTLLQFCGIDHRRLRCAVERTPEKWGLETSGTRIPIIAEADWRVDPAPCVLLGAWQWRDQFIAREAEYLSRGGCFLVPLPKVEVIVG